MYVQSNNPFKKRMGKFKHSDAPDAKGKFKSLSASGLASWMIKSRKGCLLYTSPSPRDLSTSRMPSSA